MNTIHITNYQLPNGALYTGDAIDFLGNININGEGRAINLDRSVYEGQWRNGMPFGYGKFNFANGDEHVGYFEDRPNGPGYLVFNNGNTMNMGNFRDGKLHGWAICMDNGNFSCAFFDRGRIVDEYNMSFLWFTNFLHNTIFATYHGNYAGFYKDSYTAHYGAPRRTKTVGDLKYRKVAIGYFFTIDGSMYVGAVGDVKNLNGKFIKCTPNKEFIIGEWKDNVFLGKRDLSEIIEYTTASRNGTLVIE